MIEDISEPLAAEDRVSALNQEWEARVSELEDANEELAIANKELEAFSSTVSHDLKGPLVSIAQFSQILLDKDVGPLTDQQEDLLRRIRVSGLRAKHIIDDLRDLADVTRREIFAEEVDMSAMAQQIIDELAALAPDRHVTFTVRADLRADGDPTMVRLLLVNLLQNAWKYTAREERAIIEMTTSAGRFGTSSTSRTTGSGSTTCTANGSSRRSNGCVPRRSSRAPGSGSRPPHASPDVTGETSGQKAARVTEPLSPSRFRRLGAPHA